MIKICENYALEHDILFNGKKSQLLIFGEMQTQHVDIRVNGELVPLSENALHLGNYISTKMYLNVLIMVYQNLIHLLIILWLHLANAKA